MTKPVVDMTLVEADAAPERTEAKAALTFIKDEATIETMEDFRAAPKVIAQIKTRREAIDQIRRRWIDPLNSVVADINGTLKPAIDDLDEAEKILKMRLHAFRNQQDAVVADKMSDAEQALKAGRRPDGERLIAEADEAKPPKLKGVTFRESWTGEVSDASAIPEEYMAPDEKKLKAVTKAAKGDPGIPGWRAFKAVSVAISKALAK